MNNGILSVDLKIKDNISKLDLALSAIAHADNYTLKAKRAIDGFHAHARSLNYTQEQADKFFEEEVRIGSDKGCGLLEIIETARRRLTEETLNSQSGE